MAKAKAKEIPIPDELKILNADLATEIVVIGSKAYEISPVFEGDLEKIIGGIASVMDGIQSPNGKCPKCGKVIENALLMKVWKCPDDQESLVTMNKSPVEAIVESSQIPVWVEVITGLPADDIRNTMTLKQIRHFAGIFWKQNLSEENLPKESIENFQKLLGTMGLAKPQEEKKASPQKAEEVASLPPEKTEEAALVIS